VNRKEKIRILLTNQNLETAGSRLIIYDLVRKLDKYKFEITVGLQKIFGNELEKKIMEHCSIIQFNQRIPLRPLINFPFLIFKETSKIKDRFDIIHSFDYSLDWTEPLLAKISGIKYITEKTNSNYKINRALLKYFFSDKIIVHSAAIRNLMNRWNRKTRLIYFGIDIGAFQSALPIERESLGFNKDDVILISVANIVPLKGFINLLQAINKIHKQCPRLKVLIAGRIYNQEHKNDLDQYISDHNLKESVYFLGFISKVAPYLKMCDGKILVSLTESFGVSIIEAMACELPVIATKCGGPDDIVINNETGWLIEPGNMDAIAVSIEDFYNDGKKRKKYGSYGLKRVHEIFNLDALIKGYEEIYFSVLGSK